MPVSFTLVKRGYNPVEVDNYIKNLEAQINEYKEKASAINNAIINAQLAADNIIKDATLKTEKMLSSAEKDAQNMKLNAINQVKAMKSNISEQIKTVEAFNADYSALINKYLQPINSSNISPLVQKLNDVNALIDSFGDAVSKAEVTSQPSEDVSAPSFSPNTLKVEPVEENSVSSEQPKENVAPFVDNAKIEPISQNTVKETPAPVGLSGLNKPQPVGGLNPVELNKANAPVGGGLNNQNMPLGGGLNNQNMPLGGGLNNQNMPLGGGLNKMQPSGLNKSFSNTSNPFNKKPASVNPFSKNKPADNNIENELFAAATNDSLSAFDNEFSVINEETDYNSLMGEAGKGANITNNVAPSSQTSVKPGIYKTSDIFPDASPSPQPFSNLQNMNSDYSTGSLLSKSEFDELMPSSKHKK